jgi:hypothetical protein
MELAMPADAITPGIGSIVGAGIGAIGSIGQSSAAGAGAAAAQAALAQQHSDLSPYRTTGANALGVAGDLSGANGPDAATAAMANFHTDPGYQFQLDQGLRAVDAGAAAKGMTRSGATIKGEQAFGTGLADQSFTNYYNRLSGLANLGETAAAGGASTANQAAQLAQGAGNTQASIFGNAANTIGSTVAGLGSNPNVNSLFSGGSGFSPADQASTF